MVFVTLGTQNQQFTRIIDYVISSKVLKDDLIIIQSGNTKYTKEYDKKRIHIHEYIFKEEYVGNIQNSRLVVTHGGVGSIFDALLNVKKVFAVPRLCEYKEHVDNHQFEVCEELEKEGYINYMHEEKISQSDFDKYIEKVLESEYKVYQKNTDFLNILESEI